MINWVVNIIIIVSSIFLLTEHTIGKVDSFIISYFIAFWSLLMFKVIKHGPGKVEFFADFSTILQSVWCFIMILFYFISGHNTILIHKTLNIF